MSFRDYLGSHLDAKKAYEAIKIQASQAQGATEKISTGIAQYNLLKNDQIVSILKATGFDGLCVRFATQQAEHQAFDLHKKEFYGDSNFRYKKQKKFSKTRCTWIQPDNNN